LYIFAIYIFCPAQPSHPSPPLQINVVLLLTYGPGTIIGFHNHFGMGRGFGDVLFAN